MAAMSPLARFLSEAWTSDRGRLGRAERSARIMQSGPGPACRSTATITQPDYETGDERIRAIFARTICKGFPPRAQHRKPQPKFVKPCRGLRPLRALVSSFSNTVSTAETFQAVGAAQKQASGARKRRHAKGPDRAPLCFSGATILTPMMK